MQVEKNMQYRFLGTLFHSFKNIKNAIAIYHLLVVLGNLIFNWRCRACHFNFFQISQLFQSENTFCANMGHS